MSQLEAPETVETPVDHNFHQDTNAKVERWEATRSPQYWEYRQRWEQDPQNRVLRDYPIHLDIEATSACNLKCVMCTRTELVERKEFWKVQAFDFDKYRQLIDEGVKNGLCSIKYNYLGEPLLNKRLVEMIEYAKQAGIADVMFNTNAVLLDEETSRRLIASGLDKLFFSFDSADRDQYHAIRIGADYDQVLTNIRNFMKVREEMGAVSPFTRVSMVLMKDNQDQWQKFRQLFEPIVDAVAWVDYLDHTGQADQQRTVVEIGSRKTKFCCPQLWQRAFIHPDGVVTACCIDSAREMPLGNVFEQSLPEIWRGEKYQQLRDLHASGRFEEVPICSRCPLARY